MRLGIISDTHAYLDPQVARLFAGVEHILHGGDVGPYLLLHELETIAPVTAVLGNTDAGIDLPLTKVVTLANRKFLLQHIVEPRALNDGLKERIAAEKPDVVIFGHTHKPFHEVIDGVLFFNPGYAGKQRFSLERTVAILHCTPRGIRPQYFPL